MPIREKRNNAIYQLALIPSSIREIPSLSTASTKDAIDTIGLLLRRMRNDTRTTQRLFSSSSSSSNDSTTAVPKEQALAIEKAYDAVSAQCTLLQTNIDAFYQLDNKNAQQWNNYVAEPLKLLEKSVIAAINAGNDAPPTLHAPEFDMPIHISNAVLLIRTLAFKIIETISSENVEGMLRVSGIATNVQKAIDNFQMTTGLKAAEPEQRPRALSRIMWSDPVSSPALSPKLITQDQMEITLNAAKGHDFTSILKEIMLNPALIGLKQLTLDQALKNKILDMAKSIQTERNNGTAQEALKSVLEALPANYVDMLSSLLNMMQAVCDPALKNKMNADNAGLALPGIYEMIGLCDALPQACTSEAMQNFGANKISLAALTSSWIQDYRSTQKTFSDVLSEKNKKGDNSDRVYHPDELTSLQAAERNNQSKHNMSNKK